MLRWGYDDRDLGKCNYKITIHVFKPDPAQTEHRSELPGWDGDTSLKVSVKVENVSRFPLPLDAEPFLNKIDAMANEIGARLVREIHEDLSIRDDGPEIDQSVVYTRGGLGRFVGTRGWSERKLIEKRRDEWVRTTMRKIQELFGAGLEEDLSPEEWVWVVFKTRPPQWWDPLPQSGRKNTDMGVFYENGYGVSTCVYFDALIKHTVGVHLVGRDGIEQVSEDSDSE
tara:strand:+ start:847 stop:1527 length:681 start_codon:yes stop_codon:yes gene_type:complete